MARKHQVIKSNQRPLYDQAIEALNRYIEAGGLKPGDKLPAEGVLAKQLGISRPTLREAFGMLEAAGVIERRHGVGTFVTAPAQGIIQSGMEKLVSLHSLATNAGVKEYREDWVIDECPLDEMKAGRLKREPGDAVLRVRMTVRDEEESYFAFMDSCIPFEYIDRGALEQFNKGSLLDYLLEVGEPRLSYTRTHLYAVDADEVTAKWLRTQEGRSVLLLAETFYSDNGKPIVVTDNYFVTEHLNFFLVRRVGWR